MKIIKLKQTRSIITEVSWKKIFHLSWNESASTLNI